MSSSRGSAWQKHFINIEVTTQRLQNPLIKEYTLNLTRVPIIILRYNSLIKEYTLNLIRVPIII